MATNSNRKIGNQFETEFCNILYSNGFWVHNMAQNQAGQPADVIAVRDGKAYLIDCKVCSCGTFHLSRIEENQNMAMELWTDNGNGDGWFAIELHDMTIMMMRKDQMDNCKAEGIKVLSEEDIRSCGVNLERWLAHW